MLPTATVMCGVIQRAWRSVRRVCGAYGLERIDVQQGVIEVTAVGLQLALQPAYLYVALRTSTTMFTRGAWRTLVPTRGVLRTLVGT